MSERALKLAQAAGHPYSRDYALGFTAIGRLLRGDAAAASAQLQMAARLSQEYGFVQWAAHEMILQGRVWVEQGWADAGIDRMRQGLKGWQAIGARLAKSEFTTGFDAADLQAANALLAQPDKESLLPRTCLWRDLRTHDAHRRRDSL